MRLSAWVRSRGKGAIWELARLTGVSYPTIHALAHDKRAAKYGTALKISEATGFAVSVSELCELPAAPRRPKRKRASYAPAAHG